MYRDTRPIADNVLTASTPEAWAENFAQSTPMSLRKVLRLAATKEWRLIQRYVPSGSHVLDAGCGFGEWVAYLTSKGYAAEGVDFSPEIVARLRAAYPEQRWMQGDIRGIPAPSGSFDAVISWGVIEHDEAGPGAALREFHRVLRPGGMIVVTVPIDSPAQRKSAEVMYRPHGREQVFFQYFMTDGELRQDVADAGFEVLESGTLPGAVLNLVSPHLAKSVGGWPYRAANFAAYLALSWMERYRVMRYCVAGRLEP